MISFVFSTLIINEFKKDKFYVDLCKSNSRYIQIPSIDEFLCSLRLCSDEPTGILGTLHVDLCKSNTDITLKHLNLKWFNKILILHFTPNSSLGVNFIFVSCNLLGKSH